MISVQPVCAHQRHVMCHAWAYITHTEKASHWRGLRGCTDIGRLCRPARMAPTVFGHLPVLEHSLHFAAPREPCGTLRLAHVMEVARITLMINVCITACLLALEAARLAAGCIGNPVQASRTDFLSMEKLSVHVTRSCDTAPVMEKLSVPEEAFHGEAFRTWRSLPFM